MARVVLRVRIDNFTFTPETLEIRAGTKVVWVNNDDVPHTVRSTGDVFRSEALDTDDEFERVFSERGTYEYYCGVHTHMTGKVIIRGNFSSLSFRLSKLTGPHF